jgi:hypothetical protein
MEAKITLAIETLVGLIKSTTSQDEALKYTQAALNLAHTLLAVRNAGPI